MKNRKFLLAVLFSIASIFSSILWSSAATSPADGFSINHSLLASNTPQGAVAPMIAVGARHCAGLKSDGTVVAVGRNREGQCEVSGWIDIVQVSAGDYYTVGLRSDGYVVAAGSSPHLFPWWDIVQIAAGPNYVVGIKSDRTVVAEGGSNYLWRDVSDWMDIIQVTAGGGHTVGLKVDGTVVAVGRNREWQCEVSNWTDILQVAASRIGTTVGLRSDGTVVAVGRNREGQCEVGGWTNILQISAGDQHTVGLKSDGTVVAVGSNTDGQCDVGHWTDIVQVAAGTYHTLGLKSDGTVVSTESDFPLSEWNLGITTVHTLTVSSTAGGAVTTPGEDSFEYSAGAMIRLVAKPDAGYHFVKWTGGVGAIFNLKAATTTIAINDDHSITANFKKNPPVWPIWLLIVEIIAVVVLAIFFFHERRATRTPYS